MNSKSPLVASAIRTIEIEKEAVSALVSRIGDNFEQACSLILECKGRVVVTGIGKSGHIGKKTIQTPFQCNGFPRSKGFLVRNVSQSSPAGLATSLLNRKTS